MTSEQEVLIGLLTDEQARRCTYGTREGDGRTCDCKFTMPGQPHGGERNGCPEMRGAIWALQVDPVPTRSSQDAADDGGSHGEDWFGLPGEPPSCRCGYNGTPEECAASRASDDGGRSA